MTFLLSNLRLKLLAIAFAVALWSVVAYAQNPTQSKPYNLAIDRPTLPAGLVIVGPVPQVSVTAIGTAELDGPKSDCAGTRDVGQVDLDNLQASTTTTPIGVIRDAKTKKAVPQMTVTPPQVSVKMVIQADAMTVAKPVGWTLTGQPA